MTPTPVAVPPQPLMLAVENPLSGVAVQVAVPPLVIVAVAPAAPLPVGAQLSTPPPLAGFGLAVTVNVDSEVTVARFTATVREA